MNKQKPLVSIIIPNYNHARYVGDAIHSVLSQTHPGFEIIVVDDGSTDDSRQVIGEFGEKVRAIYKDNAGLSAARNTGIEAAQGDYIGVLDADDMYEPRFIEILLGCLEEAPDADGIHCGYRFVDHQNQPLPQVEARDVPPGELFQALVDGNFLVPESMFLRRHCYDQAGLFDISLTALEDLDMWLRVSSRFRIISTTEVLTRHRVLPGSMSADPTRQFQNRMKVICKHFGEEPGAGGTWSPAQRRAYGRGYLISAVEYLQANNESRASECVRSMAQAWPDLLGRMETFYELGCGSQPKGYRGEFASLDLERNYQVVTRLLEGITQVAGMNGRMQTAMAHANHAFGRLAYGQGRTSAARSFLVRALRFRPAFLVDRSFAGALIRSMLGVEGVRRLKAMAEAFR